MHEKHSLLQYEEEKQKAKEQQAKKVEEMISVYTHSRRSFFNSGMH